MTPAQTPERPVTPDTPREEPLPCPFCGSPAMPCPSADNADDTRYECSNDACFIASTKARDMDVPLAVWNRRALPPSRPAKPTGGLDEALKALDQLDKLSHDDDCALMAEGSHPEARCDCCLRFALGELRYFLSRRTVPEAPLDKPLDVVAALYWLADTSWHPFPDEVKERVQILERALLASRRSAVPEAPEGAVAIIASEISDAIAAHDAGETVNATVRAEHVAAALYGVPTSSGATEGTRAGETE